MLKPREGLVDLGQAHAAYSHSMVPGGFEVML